MTDVVLDQLTKVYDNGFRAVTDLSLQINDGEFLVLVGPSGCGKTTALRMIAGLEEITAGTIRIGARVVNHLSPKDRDIAMVFQSYALYPHMTVAENIGYGLRIRRLPKDEIRRRVRDAAELLGLTEMLDRKPRQLSGGQRQRVAMGRAIVREPQVYLMDEPLSNLDAKLRVQMRAEIAKLQHNLGVTTVYVTHDQVEAMTMGHRVAVLKSGQLLQVDTPQRLYEHPDNLFVAGFIGSPAMNLTVACIERSEAGTFARIGDQRLRIDHALLERRPRLLDYAGRDVALGIRPEDMEDAALRQDASSDQRLRSSVELTEALGSEIVVHFALDARPVVTEDTRLLAQEVGVAVEARSTFVASFGPRTRVRAGDSIEVAVDTARMHFFDLETGASILD